MWHCNTLVSYSLKYKIWSSIVAHECCGVYIQFILSTVQNTLSLRSRHAWTWQRSVQRAFCSAAKLPLHLCVIE